MKREPLRSQQRGKSPAKWKALHGSRIEPLLILSVPNNFRTSSPPPPPGALPCGLFQLLLLCTNHPKAWPLKTTISLGSRSLSVRNQKAQGQRGSLCPVVSETSAGKRQRLERLADQPLEPHGGLSAPTAGSWLGSPGLLASPPATAFPGDCFSFLTTQRQGPHSKCPQMGDVLPFVS